MRGSTAAGPVVVGREVELARVASFVSGAGPAQGLVLEGEPGIGKSTVWEGGGVAARERGLRVLSARASEPELRLSFVAISDLLDEVDLASVDGVPVPQLRALEVALLQSEPEEAPPERWAVAAGFTRVLRSLAEQGMVVVAVDDVPWLDRASHDALAFAARRLRGRAVRFLLTRRPGEPSALESAFGPAELARLELGALSLGAVRSLLLERLELRPPRRVLLRLFELSHGSPLVALELGRMLIGRGLPDVGEELPLPELVDDLFGQRIAGLDPSMRRALLAVALSGGLARLEVSSLVGPRVVEDAIRVRVLVPDGSRVRAAHPLLAAAARRSASVEQRRNIHLELARMAGDETLSARHLGLAALRPEAELAQRLADAAETAIGRGAVDDAVELAQEALRLTPVGDGAQADRLLALAECLLAAGELTRLRELLEPRLQDLRPGSQRARAHLLLGDPSPSVSEHLQHLERALEEADDPSLRASVLARKAEVFALYSVERVAEAEVWASEAVRLGALAGGSAVGQARQALGWVRILRGLPLEDLRNDSAAARAGPLERLIDHPAAIRLAFRGETEHAQAELSRLLATADERGAAYQHGFLHLHLCELMLRIGDCAAALELLTESDWMGYMDAERLRCEALLAILRGDPSSIECARLAVSSAEEHVWQRLEAQRAAGSSLLFAGEPRLAVEQLRAVWEHTQREGVTEPGAFPVAPDLVEALAELDALEEARAVTETLARLAVEQDHPWGRASAKRCRALVRLAARDEVDVAEVELSEAAEAYSQLGLRADAARSHLILGRARRRRRRWAAARESLELAAALFTGLGAAGWAERAGAELSRVGARRPAAAGALTSMERQVAELAALGRSNKLIAAELHVTVNTVEKHLSHAYAKLGVRSRGELTHRLPSPS